MVTTARIAEVAALMGDPARTAMLVELAGGRALTSGELARIASVAPQTASGHLTQLVAAGLLAVTQQGRHRYHRIASPRIAGMIEGLMQVAAVTAPESRRTIVTGPRDRAMRFARTCYDHLAGRLGVAIADALVGRGHVEFGEDAGALTPSGVKFLRRLDVDFDPNSAVAKRGGRVFCRPCLDWSERRPHVAGTVGTAICRHMFSHGWIRRIGGTRALHITPPGAAGLRSTYGIDIGPDA